MKHTKHTIDRPDPFEPVNTLRIFYSKVDDCFWLIDLKRETQTRLTEQRLRDILQNSKCSGWQNLDVLKQYPNHLFVV